MRAHHSSRAIGPGLVLSMLLLASCGPRSLRSHLPPMPPIYLFQNTAPVQAAPASVILPINQMPGSFVQGAAPAGDNATLTRLSVDPKLTAAQFARWHRIDGALATYDSKPTSVQGALLRTVIQLDLGRYPTTGDAIGDFRELAAHPAMIGHPHAVPASNLGPSAAGFAADIGAITLRSTYFQVRNYVVRINVLGPAISATIQTQAVVAKRQYDRIYSAK